MNAAHRGWLVLIAGLVALGLGLAAVRVRAHEAAARTASSRAPRAVGAAPTLLVESDLVVGHEVVFEVCSAALRGGAPAPVGLRLDVRDAGANALAISRSYDTALAATTVRGARFGCVAFGRTASLGVGGRFAILASSEAPLDAPFVGRIVSRTPLDRSDRLLVAGLGLLALLGLGLLARRPAAPPETRDGAPGADVDAAPHREAIRVLGAAALALGIGFVATRLVPVAGAAGGLARGTILLAAEFAIVAWALMGADEAEARTRLGIRPPSRALAWVAVPMLAIGVQVLALVLLHVLPSTGPSVVERLVDPTAGIEHVQTILASFGGLVAFGAVAVLAPVLEELFFRGVVYGAVERVRGPNAALVVTALVFVLAHLPQLGGARAALVSVSVLSIVATTLRRTTGSVLVPALMHFLHNAIVVSVALANAR